METHKLVCTMQAEQEQDFDDMGDMIEGKRFAPEDSEEEPVRNKQRISKRARKKQKKTEDDDVVQNIGDIDENTGGTSPKSIFEQTKFRDKSFFMSEEVSKDVDAKEYGLEMDQFQMDLLGDEGSTMKSDKQVRRWDARKKKYVMMHIGSDGKQIKKKSESGKVVHGEKEKTNAYVK